MDRKVDMTLEEFMTHCTECGGNWGAMLLTGIKAVFPEYHDEVEKTYNGMDFSNGGIKPFAYLCEWLNDHGIRSEEEEDSTVILV